MIWIVLGALALALYVVPRLLGGRPLLPRSLRSDDPGWHGPRQADNAFRRPPTDH